MTQIAGGQNGRGDAAPRGATITAIGGYVPERVLTNRDLEEMVDTSDEWIVQRTGIHERRIAAPDEFTSDMCTGAARDLARRFDTDLKDVDFIIVATTTPDYAFPSVASQVQDRLGIPAAGAIDLNATCAGFAYGLHIAHGLVASGVNRKVLVLAGETLSKVTDYTDRATCVLFGDGAGAALVEPAREGDDFLAYLHGSQGSGGRHLYRQAISRRFDPEEEKSYMRQNGREVYKWAVQTISAGVLELLEKAGLAPLDIDWFVPHSANLRITDAICDRTGIPFDRMLESGSGYGNTSSASIPLALSDAVRENRIRYGDTVLLYGFGGGLVHAGMICRWTAGGA
ncbi:MAG TPA: ketoacyl-ACP synthase III [Longimicrobiales bacterium]